MVIYITQSISLKVLTLVSYWYYHHECKLTSNHYHQVIRFKHGSLLKLDVNFLAFWLVIGGYSWSRGIGKQYILTAVVCLYLTWSCISCVSTGESVGFYFGWMTCFTWTLVPIAFVGILLHFFKPRNVTVDDNPLLPLYEVLMAFWAISFLTVSNFNVLYHQCNRIHSSLWAETLQSMPLEKCKYLFKVVFLQLYIKKQLGISALAK